MPALKELEAPPIREDGLQLLEDRALQRRIWSSQRIAWLLFGLLLLGALLGLTGSGGYLSSQSLEFGQAKVEMPRIARWQASDTVLIELQGTAATEVVFGPGFSKRFAIESITPEPADSVAGGSGVSMTFDISGQGTKTVLLGVRPTRPGWIGFDMSVAGETRSAWALVLP